MGWPRAAGFISSRRAASRASSSTESSRARSIRSHGRAIVYSSWEELHKGLAKLLSGAKKIAMQYSPENNIPYIGLVDAGTVELIRKLKKKVVSSADLVQKFEASWTAEQLESHLAAGKIVDRDHARGFLRAASIRARGQADHGMRAATMDARRIPRERPDDRRAAHRRGAAE